MEVFLFHDICEARDMKEDIREY